MANTHKPVIALTGATGFVGKALMWQLLAKGYKIQALARKPQDPMLNTKWVVGDLSNTESLNALCAGADTIIHVAGAIKAQNRDAFMDINEGGTLRLLDAARAAGFAKKGHVIHISSLAAREPELSDYSFSKHKAEEAVRAFEGAWTILRPPAVYGPDDPETLKLFKLMAQKIAPIAGSNENRFSLIHVDDLSNAIMAVMGQKACFGQCYELADEQREGYRMADLAKIAGKAFSHRIWHLPIPKAMLGTAAYINNLFSPLFGIVPILTPGKARELTHPDWVSRNNLLTDSGLWQPSITLDDGLPKVLLDYRRKHML